MTATASQSILAYNSGREPERLAMKMRAMRQNAFVFLRGTDHLFHERMIEKKIAPNGPSVWMCGDLHLENVGTFLGGNGLTYFDVNDFDEAVCAPLSWDITRLATSLIVAAPQMGLKRSAAKTYASRLIGAYFAELVAGKPRWIERRTAQGPILELIDNLKKRDTRKFLDKRAIVKGGKRSLTVDGVKTLPLAKGDRAELGAFMGKVAKAAGLPRQLAFIDAARRIAGTGSLGVQRYVILVEGDGSPDGNWMIDIKQALPSAVAPYVGKKHEWSWPSEAHRVVAIQSLLQARAPSLLSAQSFRGQPYLMKQMQPSADRLDLAVVAKNAEHFEYVIDTMAKLAAWGHLRGTGRFGAATADTVIAAAGDRKAARAAVEAADAMAAITVADYEQYCGAFDNGEFATVLQWAAPTAGAKRRAG